MVTDETLRRARLHDGKLLSVTEVVSRSPLNSLENTVKSDEVSSM